LHHENLNADTVTVEGFSLEVWDYEETYYSREQSIWIKHSDTPTIPAKKLLRRIKQLAQGGHILGSNPKVDLRDLKEFTGGMWYFPLIPLRMKLLMLTGYQYSIRRPSIRAMGLCSVLESVQPAQS
jgi:hypothetical protein